MKKVLRFVGYLASVLFGVVVGFIVVGAHLYPTLLIDGVDATRYGSDEIVAMIVNGQKMETVTYVVFGGDVIAVLPGSLWNLLVLVLSALMCLIVYHLAIKRVFVKKIIIKLNQVCGFAMTVE